MPIESKRIALDTSCLKRMLAYSFTISQPNQNFHAPFVAIK
jgi:hypothetical protein